MAETCRKVGRVAEALGLSRPSVVHLRTYVREHREAERERRERREILKEIALDMAAGVAAGRIPNIYVVEERAIRRVRG